MGWARGAARTLMTVLRKRCRASTLLEVVDLLVLGERGTNGLLSIAHAFLEQHVGGRSLTGCDCRRNWPATQLNVLLRDAKVCLLVCYVCG